MNNDSIQFIEKYFSMFSYSQFMMLQEHLNYIITKIILEHVLIPGVFKITYHNPQLHLMYSQVCHPIHLEIHPY